MVVLHTSGLVCFILNEISFLVLACLKEDPKGRGWGPGLIP